MVKILSNISNVLGELDKMVLKYRSLGKTEKRKRDRLRFGAEDLNTLCGKLTFHTSAIVMFEAAMSGHKEVVLELQLYCIQRLINSISGIGTNVSASLKSEGFYATLIVSPVSGLYAVYREWGSSP
jgi:hypothetical protein